MDKDQIFLHQKIYPKASDIFNVNIKPLEDIIDDCIFIIDTNVLLLPYTTSSSGFEEIKKAFSKLISNNQLLIPAQVAREFAKNRPEKIKTLFQQLNVTKSKIHKPVTGQYPLLESLDEYKEAVELEKKIQEVQAKYSKKLTEVIDKIKQWRWDDPVSLVYKDLFKPEFIKDLDLSEEDIIKDLERRNKYSIPPGFNDKNKDDYGVGDLIIWLTILQISKEKNKDVVFISGDEKNDWFYRSESQSLYPRFELITEFKNYSNDKTLHIIKLSELLVILGASKEAVNEVEIREVSTGFSDIRSFFPLAEKSIYKFLVETEKDSEIEITNNYPEMLIRGSNTFEGVDIIVNGNRRNVFLSNRIKDRYMRAYFEINEQKIDRIRIFIALQNIDYLENIFNEINRLSANFKCESITFCVGLVSEEGEFRVINKY